MDSRPNSGGKMSETRFASALVRFDAFEVDLRAGELRKEGRKIKLQEQPFRVLSYLLERAGDVVTREELREKLWSADTFVDFDHSLNSAVARLREALRDSADKPRFVETVAKRGYRFIGSLRPATPVLETFQPALQQRAVRRRVAGRIWMTAAFFVALFSAVAIWPWHRRSADSQLSRIEVVPLISMRGFQATPAFSPSGTLVAFRQSDFAGNAGIYAAAVRGEKSVQVTNNPGDCCPTWSPNGDKIASLGIRARPFRSMSFQRWAAPNAGSTKEPRRWDPVFHGLPTGNRSPFPRAVLQNRLARRSLQSP
jgi:DNA-binding winged helix-turn-helix (wHTH) protein